MSEIEKEFKNNLISNKSCDEVYKELSKLSKNKLRLENIESTFINYFLLYSKQYFKNAILELFSDKNKRNIEISPETVFKISYHIMKNKNKYDNKYLEKIRLLYDTLFFMGFSEEDETNDFTFYKDLPKYLISPKDYEAYLLNIGIAILSENNNEKLLEMLFSEETHEFFKNIVLTTFEYARALKKNISEFINLCVPCLNHYNSYYLSEAIYGDLQYKFNNINEINYIKLEKYILSFKKNIFKNPDNNLINISLQQNKAKRFDSLNNEEFQKYFNFSNEKEDKNILEFFTDDNLKENNKKFKKLIESKDLKIKENININFDKPIKDDKSINVFSFIFLLKNGLIQQIDEHFFQIFNYGNIKIEIFSYLLLKCLKLMNEFLNNSLTEEQKLELFQNSGFYKLNNEYVLLLKINEKDEMLFYLKNNLGTNIITSINDDIDFQAYQVNQSDFSSVKINSESEYLYIDDNEENSLFNFGNYSFENELRKFFNNFISGKENIYELPRLYFLMNFSVPISKNVYNFISNIKIPKNKNVSYGYGELDFVLKNAADEDVKIDGNILPYKEKIFMSFPKPYIISNNGMIILKKKSIIFFEFKTSFPQFFWKDKFHHLFSKIKKFIEIYKNRGDYNQEYLQIFFVYDTMPEIYNIRKMKSFISKNFSHMFSNFEFGIYYFTRGINLINEQIIEQKINDNVQNLENKIISNKDNLENKIISNKENLENKLNIAITELNETKKFSNEILSLFQLLNNENLNEKIKELKKKYNIKD